MIFTTTAACCLFLTAQAAYAAPQVTWDDPAPIKSTSVIDTHGTLVHAGYWGSNPVTVTVGAEKITFDTRKVGAASDSDGLAIASGNGTASGGFSGDTGDPKFNSVLDSFDYDGNSPREIAVAGLVPGHNYEIQLFALDDRTDTQESSRTIRFGDKADFSGNNSKSFKEGDNVAVTGHFTADAKKISIYEDISSLGNLNAYVLRDVTTK